MLPDFPSLKEKFVKAVNRYLRHRARNYPLFRLVKHEFLFEGDRLLLSTPQGDKVEELEKHSSDEYTIPREELIERGPGALVDVISKMAEDIQKELSRSMLDALREATDAAGQVVKGRPFDFDTFIEGLEKIDIDFDENGEPCEIQMLLGPNDAERFTQQVAAWEANAEYKARYAKLMEAKRAEWNDRESRRKLVD